MTQDNHYEFTYPIQWRDTDQHSFCRPSSLLAFFQESALDVPESMGLTPLYLEENYGGFWMLTRVRYSLTEPIRWQEEITLRTCQRPPKAMMFYRDYDILKDGRKIGEAVALWGLANLESRRLLDLNGIHALFDFACGALCRKTALRRNQLPEQMDPLGEHLVGYSHTDRNGHLNNCKYADFICDCIPALTEQPGAYLSALQIDYWAECRPGSKLTLCGKIAGRDCYFRGVNEAGELCFDAVGQIALAQPQA